MSRRELAHLIAATRGALAWMEESGEAALPVPEGFELPPLGSIAAAPPRRGPAAQSQGVQPQAAPTQSVGVERAGARGAEAQPVTRAPEAAAPRQTPAEPSLSQMPSVSTLSTLGAMGPGERIQMAGEGGRPALVAQGPQPSPIMFLGEPHTDALPEPLVPFDGAAGALLGKMIKAMGLRVDQVALVNVFEQGGARWCSNLLAEAVATYQPKVIVAMGVFPARALLKTRASMARMRGRWHEHGEQALPVMVTFPPGLLLKHPDLKRPVWGDLKKVMARLSPPES